MSITFAAQQTAVVALATAASTLNVVKSTATALSDLAEMGAAYASYYKDVTVDELTLSREEVKAVTRDRVDARIARANVNLIKELAADPLLEAEFKRIRAARSAT